MFVDWIQTFVIAVFVVSAAVNRTIARMFGEEQPGGRRRFPRTSMNSRDTDLHG